MTDNGHVCSCINLPTPTLFRNWHLACDFFSEGVFKIHASSGESLGEPCWLVNAATPARWVGVINTMFTLGGQYNLRPFRKANSRSIWMFHNQCTRSGIPIMGWLIASSGPVAGIWWSELCCLFCWKLILCLPFELLGVCCPCDCPCARDWLLAFLKSWGFCLFRV